MALMKCPECGNSVAENADKCPNCGCVFETEISTAYKIVTIILAIVCPVAGFILAIIGLSKGDKGLCRIALIVSILLCVFLFLWIFGMIFLASIGK